MEKSPKYLVITLMIIGVLAQKPAAAQFSAGSSFFVKGGTALFIDSLTIVPAPDTELSGTEVSTGYTPIGALGTESIKRVYTFAPGLSFRGQVGLFFDPLELNSHTAASLYLAYEASGGSFTTTNLITLSNDFNYVLATTGIHSISLGRVTAFGDGNPLPVTLAAFSVRPGENQSADLHWTTSSETNASHFDIERSPDARDWQKVGRLKAGGESNGLESYSFTDQAAGRQLSAVSRLYYRLKMVDRDGSFAYSPIRSLTFKPFAATAAVLYPNPATDKVYLQNLDWSEVASVTMYGIAGNEVTVSRDKNTQSLDVSHLPVGVYLLRIGRKDSLRHTYKVLVDR